MSSAGGGGGGGDTPHAGELQRLLGQWAALRLAGEEAGVMEAASSALVLGSSPSVSGSSRLREIDTQLNALMEFRAKLQNLQDKFLRLLASLPSTRARLVQSTINEIKFRLHTMDDAIDR